MTRDDSKGLTPNGGTDPGEPVAGARRYIEQVLAGQIVVGQLVRLAVERHVRDLQEGAARGLHFDEKAAARAILFFRFLRHSKGEWGRSGGQPFALAGWQCFILYVVFGWKKTDPATGDVTRRFRTAYCEIARKNGKSTFAAGIGLFLFDADGEPGAEVYTAATKRDQARIVHAEAIRMVKKSPPLKKRIRVYKDNLHVEKTASKYEPLGADGDSIDGLNPHGAIVDELHQHKTRKIWDALDQGTGARRQALIFAITTAGFNQQSVCWEIREHAVRVLNGVKATGDPQAADPQAPFNDDSYFAFIATLDEGDDWRDEKNWPKANPNLGVSVKLEGMRSAAKIAASQSSALNTFLTKRLNIWTRQKKLWLRMDKWDSPANAAPFVKDDLTRKGRRACGGLDLAKTGDLTAFVLDFENDDGSHDVLAQFWMPEERAQERDARGEFGYLAAARAGLITLTGGDSTDYRFVRQQIVQTTKLYDLQSIAFDPWNARHLVTELIEEDGLDAALFFEFAQTVKNFNEPSQYLETLVNEGKFHHGGNAVLRFHASNVTVKTDPSGNIRPVKPDHLDPKKIDGIVAAIMALGRAMVSEAAGSGSLVL